MKEILIGALSGDGVVTNLAGREVHTVRLEYFGQWSMGQDALHLDELRIFADGRQERRNWAIQVDPRGNFIGYDTDRRARVRARMDENHVRLVYDAPMGAGAEIAGPKTVIDLRRNPDGSVSLDGRAKVLGLPYRRTRAVLQRRALAA